MKLLVPPPEITSHPMNMTVNNGSNVTFNCVSFSYAPVTYTWLKDGITLLDDDVNINISTNNEDNTTFATTLMILDVQLSDNGEYVCNATNREDTTLSYNTTLSVLGINDCYYIISYVNNVWSGIYKAIISALYNKVSVNYAGILIKKH